MSIASFTFGLLAVLEEVEDDDEEGAASCFFILHGTFSVR